MEKAINKKVLIYDTAEQIHKLLVACSDVAGSQDSATCALRIASALWQHSATVSELHSSLPSPEPLVV